MSYSLKMRTVNYAYNINSSCICPYSNSKDLGAQFDSKFSFVNHIRFQIKSVYYVLGFIYRNYKDFSNVDNILMRLLYCSVRIK